MSVKFKDTATFDENMQLFERALVQLDAQCGPVLASVLTASDGDTDQKGPLLNKLFSACEEVSGENRDHVSSASPVLPSSSSRLVTPRWFLEELEVEGLRGINNDGNPLRIKFKIDGVTSVSAPNGVGKSSIYDALSLAIAGKIPKLDRVPQVECPKNYFVNVFHPDKAGFVALTLRQEGANAPTKIVVSFDVVGNRTVKGPPGVDAVKVLASLDREFVLLDGQTFQSFIDQKSLDRGRNFAGLLGLARYSELRQALQAVSNTRAFNTHFETSMHAVKVEHAKREFMTAEKSISADYEALIKEPMPPGATPGDCKSRCHAALHSITLLKEQCADRGFLDIDVQACIDAVKAAEGGPKRDRLSEVIREQERWERVTKVIPEADDLNALVELVESRDDALKGTAGDLLHRHLKLTEEVMNTSDWPETLCPSCDRDEPESILERVRTKLANYATVERKTAVVAKGWGASGCVALAGIEDSVLKNGDAPMLQATTAAGEAGLITREMLLAVIGHVTGLREHARRCLDAVAKERRQLESELPPSLVTVTTSVETARRLQSHWKKLKRTEELLDAARRREDRVARVKNFLDRAYAIFAAAESTMALTRLQKVEPICQEMFAKIIATPIVPGLQKKAGSEEVSINLSAFWGLGKLSAQALLSESHRNAVAVTVYLAAAKLYGGAPRFIVLDDVTSSFDAGHQHHLLEVIRTELARPMQPSGLQVIFLSHDTLLEKLFNRNASSNAWSHHRLEGTPRTAVLIQTGATNKLRDRVVDLLMQGRVEDAAPGIRPFLEYTLHKIVDRCHIPVPVDLAFNDERKMATGYIAAIESVIDLAQSAQRLALDSAQGAAFRTYVATIVGNYTSHWATGHTQAFSASALLMVVKAIDNLEECFKHQPASGGQKQFYKSLVL